jgi:hypothetical protein
MGPSAVVGPCGQASSLPPSLRRVAVAGLPSPRVLLSQGATVL